MQKINLTEFGLQAITNDELENTEGGLIWFLLAGGALLLTSCSNSSQSGSNNVQVNINCINCSVTTVKNGDTTTVKVIKKP
jgi:hypothetical protein